MSQHGCPERLSNRSKVFQEEGPVEPTMELLVETLTGTAFEMTVSPSDTIFAIKSKIFRVEGIPVAQQHLLYNLKELSDSSRLSEHAIGDGARLRLVLGMRGGPISTRRLPPAPAWPRLERLLDRDDDWPPGCKVTVLVFRDGERVNMLRVKENHDGTYSPLDHNKYSSSLTHLVEGETEEAATGSLQDNAVTMNKMMELRRRMETLSLTRHAAKKERPDAGDMHKTRSEETLAGAGLLDDGDGERDDAGGYRRYADYGEEEAFGARYAGGGYSRYAGGYARYDYSLGVLPPIGARAASEQSVRAADGGVAVGRAPAPHAHSASSLALRPAPPAPRAPLHDALLSSSTSELENIKRNSSRLLPALSRHRPRSQLHLSDSGLHLPPAPPPAPAGAPGVPPARRARCAVCRRRLGAATTHRCRCGAACCAPHRYPEAHGCRPPHQRL